MSEEEKKKLNAFDIFEQSQMTFAEAEKKAKKEAGRPQAERFRIGEDGEYPLRILPLAPTIDKNGNLIPLERKGYEYPLNQQFISIDLPAKKGKKPKNFSIPVIRTTDKEVGFSVDLIDTYVKIAKELYPDDTELIEKMEANSFHNDSSLKWNYQHAIYVLDVNSDKSRAKGPQIWQCSHTVYKAIDNAKMRLWRNMVAKHADASDPVAGINNSYDVTIIRDSSGKKTEYTVEIGRDFDDLDEKEIETLLGMPRIPELVFRFTRYQLEAELAFLQQYDEKHNIDVCKESDFKEAVKKLKGELPADDNSHFDLTSAGGDKDSKSGGEVTVDSLWNEYDKITDEGADERSDEYQELREKIRQFAEDNDLDVRLSRSKNNKQLLTEVEEAYEDKQREVRSKAKAKAKEDADERDEREDRDERPERRSSRSSHDEREAERDDESDDKDNEKEPEKDSDEEEEQPRRRRRSRPSDDEPDEKSEPEERNDEKEPDEDKEQEEEKPAPASDEERPLHRRRRR